MLVQRLQLWLWHPRSGKIARWAKENDIDVTLFHGRGGAVGRGGDPANRAVLAQPVGSVNCRFKLTKQGELFSLATATARWQPVTLSLLRLQRCFSPAPSVERRTRR